MASVGDIIEIKDFQTMSNISGDILNVWHFEVLSVVGSPVVNNMGDFFTEAWRDDWFAPAINMQSNAVTHVRLEVNNLMHYTTEFGVFSFDPVFAGNVADQFNSSSTAWSFEQVRLFRTTRNGSKRIAGVPEVSVTNNVVAAGAVTAAAIVATRWADALTVGDESVSMVLRPVIIRKPALVGTPPTVINPVAAILFRGVGSQNSRKQLL